MTSQTTVPSFYVPNLCSHCGEKPGNFTFEFTSSKTDSSWTGKQTTTTWKFNFPVCEECYVKLKQGANLEGIRAMVAFAGLVIGGIVAFIVKANILVGLGIGVVAGLVLGEIILRLFFRERLKQAGDIHACGYNGQYFSFKNAAFHTEFARLNPTLVKPEKVKSQ